METLDIKINKMKQYINTKDISAINKLKLSVIKENNKYNLNEEDFKYIDEYNYYVKFLKNLKKYIRVNNKKNIIIKVYKDNLDRLMYIIISIDIDTISVGIPVDIQTLSGSKNKAYMECIYYQYKERSSLYINNFRAIKSKNGYGGKILINLKDIIRDINNKLKDNNLKEIKIIEGLLVADENIISEKDLRNLYKKYGFIIDDQNNISINLEKVV
ncbi:hypothetical protein [Romboutsia sp. 1001713B170131_170501_G6]|uniref:hypothetical protein n=1 Tax=Romboutsia sp. 1001713B170131_170501_G6 TaxID=2787108 RepID=UPI0018A9C077|nr:hypothetical protein [Romboutsia sp. 1001713B170131_170501_G6]